MLPIPATPVAPFLRTSCVAEPYQIRPFLYRSYIVLIYFLYAVYKKYMRTIWEVYKNDIRRAEFGAYWVRDGDEFFYFPFGGGCRVVPWWIPPRKRLCKKNIFSIYNKNITLSLEGV